MMRKTLIGILCLPLLAVAETGYISQATELRDTPNGDAPVLRALPAATPVDIRRRQGGWYEVLPGAPSAAAGQSAQAGWVRMSSLRLHAPGERAGLLDGGRALATQTVATTGVRGLSGEDLQKAAPDLVAVASLDAMAVSAADARDFAEQGGLESKGAGTQAASPAARPEPNQ
jgi:hypothetical protein